MVKPDEISSKINYHILGPVIATIFATIFLWARLLFVYLLYQYRVSRIPLILYAALKLIDPAVENAKGRPIQWIQNHWLWDYITSYFPFSYSFEKELSPSRQYIFGFHPHGLVSYAAQIFVGSAKYGIKSKLNGINLRLVTVPMGLRSPFFGDYFLALGMISCSRSCIRKALKDPETSIGVVVGGIDEMHYGEPGKPELILDKRKGFIREAIIAGADLVPVYTFGETQIYQRPLVKKNPASFASRVENFVEKYLAMTTYIFYGKFLFVPYRSRLHCVVGNPIPTVKAENPTTKEIDHYHDLYKKELVRIYEKHKHEYEPSPKLSLKIVK